VTGFTGNTIFLPTVAREIVAGGMAGQALLGFALRKPRFLESRVSRRLAMGTVLPRVYECWMTLLTVQLTIAGGWWFSLCPRYRHHTEGKRKEQTDHQAKDSFFHVCNSSMF
jgi:hypothetical protein